MKRLLLAVPAFALLASCATSQTPYAPVQNVRYQAAGTEPFWLLAIGDDRIVLRTANEGERVWPRTLPRSAGGTRSWQSGEGEAGITIEARPGPCATPSERVYEDEVTIRTGALTLTGCGGRLARRDRGE
jgi:uncharacterized membrane protein